MKWLETNDLGTAPSPLCGLEESMREMVMCCGIEGSEASRADDFEASVLGVIRKTAEEGVSEERLEAILHQIELHQREVTGDGMPYGLNLMLRALGAATHNGDAVAALDLSPAVEKLREKMRAPDFVKSRLTDLLLNNPHRVTLVVAPDSSLDQERKDREAARLATMRASLDESALENIRKLATDLEARQNQVDDASILPKVHFGHSERCLCANTGSTRAQRRPAALWGQWYQRSCVSANRIGSTPAFFGATDETSPTLCTRD